MQKLKRIPQKRDTDNSKVESGCLGEALVGIGKTSLRVTLTILFQISKSSSQRKHVFITVRGTHKQSWL